MTEEMWCWDDTSSTLAPGSVVGPKQRPEIERIAVAVHSAMAAGYAVTLPYHWHRKQYGFLLLGVAGVLFHGFSAIHHQDKEE